MKISAPKDMEFGEESTSFFHKQSEMELDLFLHSINAVLESQQSEAFPEAFTSVGWSKQKTFLLPLDVVKAMVVECLCEHTECELAHDSEKTQQFSRGDESLDRLPVEREVEWFEVPVKLQVRYRAVSDEKTTMKMVFSAPKEMEFDEECRNFFLEQAEHEFACICEMISQFQERYEDEEVSHPEDDSQDSADDYETLGIDVGSSWSDVQAAYREMCRKYHPDTLSGHGLPSHITDLAVERFKKATEAYQRLKSKTGLAD